MSKRWTESFYAFATLQEVIDYFEAEGVSPDNVGIGGAFGGSTPTEDDDPAFLWEI
jgi:hypothetical protein